MRTIVRVSAFLAFLFTLTGCKSKIPLRAECRAEPEEGYRLAMCDVRAVPDAEITVMYSEDVQRNPVWADASGATRVPVDLEQVPPTGPMPTLIARAESHREARIPLPIPEELLFRVETRELADGVSVVVTACATCTATFSGEPMSRAEDGTIRRTVSIGDLPPDALTSRASFEGPVVVSSGERDSPPFRTYADLPEQPSKELASQLATPGTPLPWAAPRQPGAARPTLLIVKDSNVTKSTGLNGLTRAAQTEVVIFAESGWQELEACGPYGPHMAWVTRGRLSKKLTAYEARTGALLKTETIRGSYPRECRDKEMINTWGGVAIGATVNGDEPPQDKIDAWIRDISK